MDAGKTVQATSTEIVPDETEIQVSLVEFDYYCTLFEEMLDEMERDERVVYELLKAVGFSEGFDEQEMDLDDCLDEFDLSEIERMRERYGLSCVLDRAHN
jgi:hypothetical protein